MNAKDCPSLIQRNANKIARNHKFGKATDIVFGDQDKVIYRVSPGFRKFTTGEYVPNAYRNNFGWKNTYYQKAITVVMLESSKMEIK